MLLQETHCTDNQQKLWASEWGGQMITSNCNSDKRGVALLFKPNISLQINKITRDNVGRFVICDCYVKEQPLLICCVCAPNEDKPQFFLDLFDAMSKHQHTERVIGGDFNLVLEKKLDSHDRVVNNDKAVNILKSYMDEVMLVDIW